MATDRGAIMSTTAGFHWASILDQDDATLSDLADAVDSLGIPLTACREILSKVGDGELDDPPQFVPSVAIALVALIDEVQSKRDRLQSHLSRLAERTTPPPSP